MPIAKEVWIEPIRPKEQPSLVAVFNLSDQAVGDPSRSGQPFQMDIEGFGDVTFNFICCIKGQAIYSASLSSLAIDRALHPERVELLCRELLRGLP